MCLHKGSSTAPTSLESLPVEIIREILIHVPFAGCQAIAMASKHHLAPTLYRDLNFARQHFLHQDAVSSFFVIWDFMREVCSSTWNAGGPLQETYMAIVHAELFAVGDFTIVWYPTVSGPVAFRIMKSLLSFHDFDPTCENNKPIRWAWGVCYCMEEE
ncbi:hypothetical protein BDR26DRAFT_867765 [Obelidium mucronatum]|nr:hypothetical protein BDR26DRAFT_867765 [Obelidium mucronatum]